jgi:hypothetical protein
MSRRRIAISGGGGSVAVFMLALSARAWAQAPAAPVEPVEPLAAPTLSEAEPAKVTAPPLPAAQPTVTAEAQASAAATVPGPPGWQLPHWDKGFVLVSSPDSDPMPFRLRLNHVSQFKYTNSLATHDTYRDHFGNEHDVQQRNDIQLARDVFYFSGYAFDKRLDFNILVFTSTATLVATAAGYAGFQFHKGFQLRVGYFSLPSTRAMTGTYPWFQGTDRSLATNYFRPGFTQGIWANGEPLPGLNYIAMVGNSLNNLDIKSSNIDHKFAYAASVWYDLHDFGPYWNDYERHDKVALRLGSAFTFAPEDRLSDLSQTGPENNVTFISDGLFLFETGALAPNVTMITANFYLWAIDAGLKYRGFAFNCELYLRWLNDFVADGPLPISNMFDWGVDSSVAYFFFKRVELFSRFSMIKGPFATAGEGSVGFTWYPFDTRQVWIDAELAYVKNSPYAGGYYMYSVGQTGLVIPVQFVLRF